MNPGVDPSTAPGYGFGVAIGASIPIIAILVVLALAVWGIRHVVIGAMIVRATDVFIARNRRTRQ